MSHEPSAVSAGLGGNDAVALLEIIHQSLYCERRDDFAGLFPKIQELLSCDFSIACLGYRSNREGVVIVDGVNISFPKGWCEEYTSRNYSKSDPVVNGNFRDYSLQWWPDVKKRVPNTGAQKKIASLCMDFNMKDGFSVGVGPSCSGKNGSMFCFSGGAVKNDNRSGSVLGILVPHLHAALTRVCGKRPPPNKKVNLSGREIEVLNWLMLGKSSWDISTILGISESTTNYHVYNIMRKLEVVNRSQAVAVAARMGLVELG